MEANVEDRLGRDLVAAAKCLRMKLLKGAMVDAAVPPPPSLLSLPPILLTIGTATALLEGGGKVQCLHFIRGC